MTRPRPNGIASTRRSARSSSARRSRSGGYRVNKAMMAIMGRPMGVPRPPTLPLDAQELGELRESAGHVWLATARPGG